MRNYMTTKGLIRIASSCARRWRFVTLAALGCCSAHAGGPEVAINFVAVTSGSGKAYVCKLFNCPKDLDQSARYFVSNNIGHELGWLFRIESDQTCENARMCTTKLIKLTGEQVTSFVSSPLILHGQLPVDGVRASYFFLELRCGHALLLLTQKTVLWKKSDKVPWRLNSEEVVTNAPC